MPRRTACCGRILRSAVGALAGLALVVLMPGTALAATTGSGCAGGAAAPAPSADGGVHLNLDPCGLPGGGSFQTLINGLGFDALLVSLAALLIGMVMWGAGSRWGNNHSAHAGKLMTVGAALAAMGVGAAPSIINFFYKSGLGLH